MPKTSYRFSALVLILCHIGNPALSMSLKLPSDSSCQVAQNSLEQQALMPGEANFWRQANLFANLQEIRLIRTSQTNKLGVARGSPFDVLLRRPRSADATPFLNTEKSEHPADSSTGALNGGQWTGVPSANPNLDIYHVEFQGRHITVLSETHPRGAHSEVVKAIQIAIADTSHLWVALQEVHLSPDVRQARPSFRWIMELPSLFEGLITLYEDGEMACEDLIQALAAHSLNGIGRATTLLELQEFPADWFATVVLRVGKILQRTSASLSNNEVSAILQQLRTMSPTELEIFCIGASAIIERGLSRSNEDAAVLIRRAMEIDTTHFLIHMGRSHLISMIDQGPFAERSQYFTREALPRWQHIYKVLHLQDAPLVLPTEPGLPQPSDHLKSSA